MEAERRTSQAERLFLGLPKERSMNETGRLPSPEGEEYGGDCPTVRATESCPGRVVLTERGNTDAWIATDLTVEPEP
jgi:hypothetical protein